MTIEITSLCSDVRRASRSVWSMSLLNMFGTSTWKMRLTKESTIAVEKGHAVRLDDGQHPAPPGEALVAGDLVARTGVLRGDPAQGIGRTLPIELGALEERENATEQF